MGTEPQIKPPRWAMILDTLRVHHGVPVKTRLAAHREAIAVHHSPNYSPELNSNERLSGSSKAD